jgi:hypothetical protein
MWPGGAAAQGAAANPLEVYFVGGLNIAKVTNSVPEITIPEVSLSTGTRPGFVGGVLVDVRLTNRFAVETGGLLSIKGGTTSATFADVDTEIGVRMTYLDVPGLIRVALGENDSVRGFLLAGATLGIHLSSSVEVSTAGISVSEDVNFVRAADVGLTIGGRVQSGRVFGDVRYTFGLISVVNLPADAPSFLDSSGKHRVLSFMGGWRF